MGKNARVGYSEHTYFHKGLAFAFKGGNRASGTVKARGAFQRRVVGQRNSEVGPAASVPMAAPQPMPSLHVAMPWGDHLSYPPVPLLMSH